jgi:hypothetical protein
VCAERVARGTRFPKSKRAPTIILVTAAETPTRLAGSPRSIPGPRRVPCALAGAASIGVFATSLAHLPTPLLCVLACVWLGLIAAGAFAPRRGPVILTVLASLTKPLTILLIGWAIGHPHSPIGPHNALDWIPLGSLNAATGLWLLAVIRKRAR